MRTIRGFLKSNQAKIFGIILISLIIDYLFILNINSPPAWDQGYHLSNVYKMYNILEDSNLNIFSKTDKILHVTDSYRGPLTYFLSAVFIQFTKTTYNFTFLSNQIFNVICIYSIYYLGSIFKNKNTGIWASTIFAFSSFIINLRTDYLIDLSLTSFTILNFLFLTKWYFDKKRFSIFSIFSGFTLGLVFLTKPTGIVLLFLPIIFTILKKIKNKKNKILTASELILFLLLFFIIIFPWFSSNWLSIITSTINAWSWGIKYQDGLDNSSIEGWLFYFFKIPLIFGLINSSIFFTIFLIEKISKRDLLKIRNLKLNKINFWFLTYLINCYFVVSLMSTKDIRFILPLYPLLCIYLSSFLNAKDYKFFKSKLKKNILIISILISLFMSNEGLILKNIASKPKYDWPHNEIINAIYKENPNLISTLAILPDTKEINTFNLEAEAARLGENVAVRQIISNMDSYKNDLGYFDWFLIKTNDQGIMSNESKNLLTKYLLKNESFNIYKKWELPDKSNLMLLKRNELNTKLIKNRCISKSPEFSLKQINNGINIKFIGKGNLLNSGIVLIDFIGEEFKKSFNISLANGLFHSSFEEDSCYSLSQNIAMDFPLDTPETLALKIKFLDKNGTIKPINLKNNFIFIDKDLLDKNIIHMNNRISKVKTLGSYLKKGEFEKLFNLVGIINQSDPKQIYLKESEKIYNKRYINSKDINDLYSILISEILQKKVDSAEKTINLIIKSDSMNGNAFLAKSIINVYLFDKKEARIAIENARKLKKSEESKEILNIVDGLICLLEMKFINAYRIFT